MGKNKNAMRVTFCGTNATEVTGSRTLLTVAESQYLFECGLHQSSKSIWEEYKINSAKFDFKAKDIDAVFVGHAHSDHVNLLPLLVKRGFTGNIYIPKDNFDLMRILMEDCAHICDKDAEFLNRTGHSVEPLYTEEDVQATLDRMVELPFGEKIVIDDHVTLRFTHSGHITNSAHIELWVTNNNVMKKIYYTSDLGNTSVPCYYVHPIEPVSNADLVIAEATYANPKRQIKPKDRQCDIDKIKTVVEQTVEKGGKVLFPVFANHRCQTILTVLYEIYGNDENFNTQIYVDSPMAVKICKLMCHIVNEKQMHVWEKVMTWKNVHFISEYADSKALQETNESCIILASSGMMSAGRSVSWAQKLLGSTKNHFVFCGYSAEGSLADKIRNSMQKTITIDGKVVPNKAYVTTLNSFSSHIQHNQMLEYYSDIDCNKIAIVHSNFNDKEKFCKELQDEYSKKNKSTKVVCVNGGTAISL